ncbi:response regulator transcription factor [Microbispora hainanensis]|uniref:response regulator n=1 Tax=Microbispora hainanensis TaxID=568844 RepID=UPI003406E929
MSALRDALERVAAGGVAADPEVVSMLFRLRQEESLADRLTARERDVLRPFRSVARALIRLLPGWRVVGEAATGEDALDLVTGGRPTMILMDINLPGINGIEATRHILAESPDVKVVLVSTYAADDLPPDAGACGALAYIRKDDLTPALLRALPV